MSTPVAALPARRNESSATPSVPRTDPIPVRIPVAAQAPVLAARKAIPGWWREASIVTTWGLGLFVVALWVMNGGVEMLGTSLGDALTSTGRLTGLLASYLLLLQVFLMARIPAVEQSFGQDALTRTHRWVGFSSFNLMLVHIGLITLGYAAGSSAGLWGTIVDFTVNYPGMLLAIAGTAAFFMVVFTSFKAARAKLRYESWHLIHLYAYLGVGLALPHQLWTGQDFLSSPAATVFWWTLYALCAGSVIVFRLVRPTVRSLRAGLRVADVRYENDSTITVTVRGRHAADLQAAAGQFFQWRFLGMKGQTCAHPYSLSAAPLGEQLRFTAAIVGDGTRDLTKLKRGQRVMVEGPYGRMHAGAAVTGKSLLMGAGIGITPMRALLEDVALTPGDTTIVQRFSTEQDQVLHEEISALAGQHGAMFYTLGGHRVADRSSWLPQSYSRLSDVEALLTICPDVRERDVYVCGAPGWMQAVETACRKAGVPPQQIHIEHFSY